MNTEQEQKTFAKLDLLPTMAWENWQFPYMLMLSTQDDDKTSRKLLGFASQSDYRLKTNLKQFFRRNPQDNWDKDFTKSTWMLSKSEYNNFMDYLNSNDFFLNLM